MDGAPIEAEIYLSYGQFMVFDRSVRLPGCDWTEAHFAQGFARRDSVAAIRALAEFGDARLRVFSGGYRALDEYARVMAVPFAVTSGVVLVEGPEGNGDGLSIDLASGDYRLVVAQTWADDQRLALDLFFERLARPLAGSEILLCDEELNPPSPLIETAAIAGQD
jgi:hypothetical protein